MKQSWYEKKNKNLEAAECLISKIKLLSRGVIVDLVSNGLVLQDTASKIVKSEDS